HNLGAEVAQKRVAEGVERLRRDYIDKLAHSEVVWTDRKADLRVVAFGQTTTAQIDVQSDLLRIEVQLPWILATLSNKVQAVLAGRAKDSLAIEHIPPKS
ncbi:MAG: hypothetical protein F9K16_15195, partial [Thermoanaerobaculia bacterium]